MTPMLKGADLYRQIEQAGRRVLLAFSRGKDSLGAWLAIRDHLDVIPFYMTVVPGLEFVEESLSYYERFFGCHICRVPSPGLYEMINEFTFQAPQNRPVIRSAGFPNFDYMDVEGVLLEDLGLDTDTWRAIGLRQDDGPFRRTMIAKHGPIAHTRRRFFPIWDWSRMRLAAEIARAGVRLPVDYLLWGRTIDGLDFRFMSVLKRVYPADYRRVLEYFPLLEADLWRYQFIRERVYIHHG